MRGERSIKHSVYLGTGTRDVRRYRSLDIQGHIIVHDPPTSKQVHTTQTRAQTSCDSVRNAV
jgi:hypothetical protein